MSEENSIKIYKKRIQKDIEYYKDYQNRLSMYILSCNDTYKYRLSNEKLLLLLKEMQVMAVKIKDLEKSIGIFD